MDTLRAFGSTQCGICLENYQANDQVAVVHTPRFIASQTEENQGISGQQYHTHCLLRWVRQCYGRGVRPLDPNTGIPLNTYALMDTPLFPSIRWRALRPAPKDPHSILSRCVFRTLAMLALHQLASKEQARLPPLLTELGFSGLSGLIAMLPLKGYDLTQVEAGSGPVITQFLTLLTLLGTGVQMAQNRSFVAALRGSGFLADSFPAKSVALISGMLPTIFDGFLSILLYSVAPLKPRIIVSPHHRKSPATAPVMQHASSPPNIARRPSCAKSFFRLGSKPPIPPTWMPMAPKLLNPANA